MSFTPNFSATQNVAFNSQITLTDSSSGSDGTLTSRRIAIRLANGQYLTEDGVQDSLTYITWPIGDVTITLNVLPSSVAPKITVDWLAASAAIYTKIKYYDFNLQNFIFALELLQSQTTNPKIVNDITYYTNFQQFIVNLWNSENAIAYDDYYSSQGALSRNQIMIDNQSYYF